MIVFRDNDQGLYDIFTAVQPSPVSVPKMPWLGETIKMPEAIQVLSVERKEQVSKLF